MYFISRYISKIFKNIQYLHDIAVYNRCSTANCRFPINFTHLYPCINDKTHKTAFDKHYIYFPAWGARVVRQINPKLHIDISSSLHFCTMLSAFIPTDFYDYRPADVSLTNLNSKKTNLLHLHFKSNSISSLSCMHVVEHIGLGRYGDTIDPEADIKAIKELKRVIASKGSLLFVVPIGRPKLAFNAHRIYSYAQIKAYFSDFKLVDFTLITDNTYPEPIIKNPPESIVNKQLYGCGCFWFKKL